MMPYYRLASTWIKNGSILSADNNMDRILSHISVWRIYGRRFQHPMPTVSDVRTFTGNKRNRVFRYQPYIDLFGEGGESDAQKGATA